MPSIDGSSNETLPLFNSRDWNRAESPCPGGSITGRAHARCSSRGHDTPWPTSSGDRRRPSSGPARFAAGSRFESPGQSSSRGEVRGQAAPTMSSDGGSRPGRWSARLGPRRTARAGTPSSRRHRSSEEVREKRRALTSSPSPSTPNGSGTNVEKEDERDDHVVRRQRGADREVGVADQIEGDDQRGMRRHGQQQAPRDDGAIGRSQGPLRGGPSRRNPGTTLLSSLPATGRPGRVTLRPRPPIGGSSSLSRCRRWKSPARRQRCRPWPRPSCHGLGARRSGRRSPRGSVYRGSAPRRCLYASQ